MAETKKLSKAELLDAIASKLAESGTECTKAMVQNVFNASVDTIFDSIASGNTVELRGFGTFIPKLRPARTARNPRTGETIQSAAHYAPTFKAGGALKEAVGKLPANN